MTLRPEIVVLLCCARTAIDVADAGRIETLIRGGIDWEYLIGLATRHRVIPLLYSGIGSARPELFPEHIRGQLRNSFVLNAMRNIALTEELVNLLDLFDANGIPAVPFKGPALATAAYGNLALRVFADLDILIPEGHVLRTKDLLRNQGYRPRFEMTAANEAHCLRTRAEYEFDREDGVHVEIHWRLYNSAMGVPEDTGALWGRLEQVLLGGRLVPCFAPEDLVPYLCVHGGVKHRWECLQWLCDVAEVIRAHRDMNWGAIMERARTQRIQHSVALGLILAGNLLGVTLPEEVAQRMCNQRINRTMARLIAPKILDYKTSSILSRCAFELIPNPLDVGVLQLPETLSFAYYAIRPIRILLKYVIHVNVLIKKFCKRVIYRQETGGWDM